MKTMTIRFNFSLDEIERIKEFVQENSEEVIEEPISGPISEIENDFLRAAIEKIMYNIAHSPNTFSQDNEDSIDSVFELIYHRKPNN
jgi:hypothetical protein